jgi:hypothetical protein
MEVSEVIVTKQTPPDNKWNYGALMSLGFQFASGIIFFVLIGQFADRKLGTGMTCTAVGMVLAFIYMAYVVWKILKEFNEK